VKKEQSGRESLRRQKPTVGCNARKRRRKFAGSERNFRPELKNKMK
jgi:hypothetical protein